MMYVFLFLFVCLCVCVCVFNGRSRQSPLVPRRQSPSVLSHNPGLLYLALPMECVILVSSRNFAPRAVSERPGKKTPGLVA